MSVLVDWLWWFGVFWAVALGGFVLGAWWASMRRGLL